MRTKIQQISELESVLCNNENTDRGILDFFNRFSILRLLKPFENIKSKGLQVSTIIQVLCLYRLRGLSVWMMQKMGMKFIYTGDENGLYRLMNNSKMNWRKLLMSFAKQFVKIIQTKGEANKSVKCFIIDDTDLEKTGKTIEFIGRIFNHVLHRSVLGMKLLALCYWDGKSLITTDFSFHREKGKLGNFGMSKKVLKAQFSKKRNKKAPSTLRIKELDEKKTEVAISMLKRAIKNGLTATYVLMDSWFTNDYIIKSIRSIKNGVLHVLGMCKIDNRKFTINQKEMNSQQITTKFGRKKLKYSRKHKSHYIPIVCEYKGERVKLFYIKYHNSQNWTLLLTTDLTLNFVKALELYQIRWTIEVLFKECKQYLRLGTCQNTDFDGQIADATIAFVTHTVLTLQRRFIAYETMGELFRETQQQMLELTLWERILKVFFKLLRQLLEILNIDIEESMEKLIENKEAGNQILVMLKALEEYEDNCTNNTKNAA